MDLPRPAGVSRGSDITNDFTFSAKLWERQSATAPSMFVTLPTDIAAEIDNLVPHTGEFGSVKANVEIGATRWSASLFPDKSSGSFVLPLKHPSPQR